MDSTDFPVSRSPRRELQGPRPPALKVRKDSHKIRKPPMAPPQQPHNHPHHHHHHSQPPRPPVIIYTVSPKVIHTNPSDFMNLVQRLTGPSSSTSTANPFTDDGGAISPAARYAAVEKAKSPKERMTMMRMMPPEQQLEGLFEMGSQVMMDQRSGNMFPGILSPGPAALPPISPSFFSPPSDPNMLSFLHDLSPVLQAANRNFMDVANFMPSPSTFVSPRFTSPSTAPSMDLFNNFNSFFDF
ncbi:VQ motif-containing protein [Euphorbia peplus]|nr:VQ motif-containing protein [Euphorbia peplus]